MGKAGRPKGALGDKPFRDALRLAVANAKGNQRTLRRLAERLYDDAVSGNTHAAAILLDRLEGKPVQGHGQDTDLGPIMVRWME